jgi:hypothetical protein
VLVDGELKFGLNMGGGGGPGTFGEAGAGGGAGTLNTSWEF